MKIITHTLHLKTTADGGMHNITKEVADHLKSTQFNEGFVIVFCVGSTCSVSTVEFEPGLCQDIPNCLERIAPKDLDYAHHETWNDDNGRSHVKATLMGPSLTIPFVDGELILGTWQQIVFLEWDTQDRHRQIILQFCGSVFL